jgi:hypothetical protein
MLQPHYNNTILFDGYPQQRYDVALQQQILRSVIVEETP